MTLPMYHFSTVFRAILSSGEWSSARSPWWHILRRIHGTSWKFERLDRKFLVLGVQIVGAARRKVCRETKQRRRLEVGWERPFTSVFPLFLNPLSFARHSPLSERLKLIYCVCVACARGTQVLEWKREICIGEYEKGTRVSRSISLLLDSSALWTSATQAYVDCLFKVEICKKPYKRRRK